MTINKEALEISRLFSVWIPVWDAMLIVSYGNDHGFLKKGFQDQPDWSKKKRRSFIEQLDLVFSEKGTTGACYLHNPDEQYHYIHIFKKDDLGVMMNHLSHEILHMVFGLLRDRGLAHSMKSEETYTYLQGFLTQRICEQLFPDPDSDIKKTKKKKTKK